MRPGLVMHYTRGSRARSVKKEKLIEVLVMGISPCGGTTGLTPEANARLWCREIDARTSANRSGTKIKSTFNGRFFEFCARQKNMTLVAAR